MEFSKAERLSLYSTLKKELSSYAVKDIENGVMHYCLSDYGYSTPLFNENNAMIVADILAQFRLPTDLETIVEFFESLLEENNKYENGIVFTPQYIAEYITSTTIAQSDYKNDDILVIDPGCGCGIFLIAAAEQILSTSEKLIDSIISDNIFGIDIVEDNVRRCKLILQLLSAKHGGRIEQVNPNIVCADSLKIDWAVTFNVNAFDYIIGNPPYVNPHDMSKETVQFLKNNYSTTQNGVFNIFYAFIEKGMQQLHQNGLLSFIVPNNFLTIKSAVELREFLQINSFIKRILDFGDNMVFKPVRTYNCIIQLSRESKVVFEYCIMPKTDNIEDAIYNASFSNMSVESLDKNGWKLVDAKTHGNLRKIENQLVPIKEFIRTGIATLKDSVYFVDKDEIGYYKTFDNKKLYIETGLVKPIYKIPDLKHYSSIEAAKRYIIFPYIKSNTGYALIDEALFADKYPHTYACLELQRGELDTRDKGKGASQGWYAYGRTQGLNKYGKKLLFPTFASTPQFTLVDDEDALFCNGYAIFENDLYNLNVLVRILNSHLMEYYVSNTSYSIEGGYYCYQKKYVERFSLPWLSEKELNYIQNASKEDLDKYLWSLYGLE